MDFEIKHLPESNMYDVFGGKGWKNWSRVLVKANFIRVIKGNPLPERVLQKLFGEIQKGKQKHQQKQAIAAE